MPTVAIESILLSSVIDAKEGRHVMTADILGAFMQADMDEVVHMRLEGKMVDLLLNVALKYAIFVHSSDKGPLRYHVCGAPVLATQLLEWGFNTYPYDPCVANNMINGRRVVGDSSVPVLDGSEHVEGWAHRYQTRQQVLLSTGATNR